MSQAGDSGPDVSVVVRAYNEEEQLPGLLQGLEEQCFDDFEIILVDSGSFDRTREIARKAGARVLRIESRDFTFGHSLNVGLEAGRGRYAAIVSAHTSPVDNRWLEKLIEPFADEHVAMVYGRQFGTEKSNFAERQDFRRRFGGEPRYHDVEDVFANNANAAIRRSLWTQHPFDEELPGLEDIAWALHWLREGLQVFYQPEAGIYHIHDETWAQLYRRSYREALAAKWIGVRNRRDIPFELGREAARFVEDLIRAGMEGELPGRIREIGEFRLAKAKGTVAGLRDGAALEDPRDTRAMYFEDTCDAVVIEGPHKARLAVKNLDRPKPGEVLIRVAYVGVCRTDLEIHDGTLGYFQDGKASYPIVPGHEFSGRVVRAGANVEGIAVGDPVVVECIQPCRRCEACQRGAFVACDRRRELGVMGIDGAYAEYVSAAGSFVHVLPSDLSLRDAALVEPLAVVLKGLRRFDALPGAPRDGDVGVVGGGPIGHLTALVLEARGNRVTAYETRQARRGALDAVATVETADDLSGLVAHGGVIEASGNPDALQEVLTRASPAGRILLLGLPYGETRFNFEELVAYDKAVVGSVGSSADDYKKAIELLPSLDVSQMVSMSLPLSEYRKGWQLARSGDALKVLLEVHPAT